MSAITKFAGQLAAADKSFTSAVAIVAEGIAKAFGDSPTFDEWEAGSAEFKTAYTAARGCNDATAANRWTFVCKEMEAQYGLSKPKKPTQAAQAKQVQRADKAAQVADILKTHKTAVDILKAAEKNPTQAAVYMDAAKELAKQTQKQATDDAKARVKALKEAIQSGIKGLTLAQLEKVAKLVQFMQPAPEAEQDPEADTEGDASPEDDAPEVNPLTVLQDAPSGALNVMQSAMARALAPAMV